MAKLRSLSLFVGTGKCNGNCPHCAGKPLRKYAPKEDGIIPEELFRKTLAHCYNLGAKTLSISSSGEPTLSPISVTKTLGLVKRCESEGIKFSQINLYSNGIKIGEDNDFCLNNLPLWKNLGLSYFYITVHSVDKRENAKFYGISKYPSLKLIISRIHDAELLMRANLVLSRQNIGTLEKFRMTVNRINELGVDSVSAWPVRSLDDNVDYKNSPYNEELDKIEEWIYKRADPKIRLLREKSREAYTQGEKLTLFPNGALLNTWCNYSNRFKGGEENER